MTDQDAQDECAEAISNVHAFFAGELSEADADAVRQHLHACEECLDSYELEAIITRLLRRANPGEAAPAQLRRRISALALRTHR